MSKYSIVGTVTTLLIALSAVAALGACRSEVEPQDRDFDLHIKDNKLDPDLSVIKVYKGDSVTLRIDSDEHGSVHLHGYDIELDVEPDTTATMQFDANATGRFGMTLHAGANGDEAEGHSHDDGHDELSEHGSLFESEALGPVQQFTYLVGEELEGKTVPYHNHLNHDAVGTIAVRSDADGRGAVEIQVVEDGRFRPDHVTVTPGTTLTWTNKTADRQMVTSGEPPTAEDHDEEGEQEVELTTFEVLPR